jgi:hypothetical protein
MSNEVYANGREVSCKAGSGKSICAFPDVCFTPPENPATPPGVPIPYPNTGLDSDATNGSKTVKISGQEVMLKNQSYFKRSTGDEAGCAAKKGVLTSVNMGKVYFTSWSMDVKVEGENVVRHLDLTTHNHNPTVGQTPPFPFTDRAALAESTGECGDEVDRAKKACTQKGEGKKWKRAANCPDTGAIDKSKADMIAAKEAMEKAKGKAKGPATAKYEAAKQQWNDDYDAFASEVDSNECQTAMRCLLAPYSPNKCCPGQTPEHLIDASCFHTTGRGDAEDSDPLKGCEEYETKKAPCMCVEGQNNTQATHGCMHTLKGSAAKKKRNRNGKVEMDTARDYGVEASQEVFPEAECSEECLNAQLDQYHKEDCEIDGTQKIRGSASGRTKDEAVEAVRETRAPAKSTR